MRKLIKVTQAHINNGVVKNTEACPVALAVKAKVNTELMQDIRVWPDAIRYTLSGFPSDREAIKVPRSVCRFIKKFDKFGKKAVKPFNFYLDIPE